MRAHLRFLLPMLMMCFCPRLFSRFFYFNDAYVCVYVRESLWALCSVFCAGLCRARSSNCIFNAGTQKGT